MLKIKNYPNPCISEKIWKLRFFDDGDPKNDPELSLVQPDLKKWNFEKSHFRARYKLKNLPHT